jgi:hypothetical protein
VLHFDGSGTAPRGAIARVGCEAPPPAAVNDREKLEGSTDAGGAGSGGLFAFCAMDALYLPFLLDEKIGIESTCQTTGEPITLTVSPEGPSEVSPASTAVSLRIPAEGFTGESSQVIENACHFTHLFASDEAAEQWAAQHDGVFVVSIEDASELAAGSLAPRLVAQDR